MSWHSRQEIFALSTGRPWSTIVRSVGSRYRNGIHPSPCVAQPEQVQVPGRGQVRIPNDVPLTSRSGLSQRSLTRVVLATQIYIIKLRAEPILELASRAMAKMGRSEHCKLGCCGATRPPPLRPPDELTHHGDRSRFADLCLSCSTLRRCSITTQRT